MVPDEALAAELRSRAAEVGIAAIGFADAAPLEAARREIERRKAEGLDAGMQFTYRAPGRSTDPQQALPGAVSLVVGAWAYGPSGQSGTACRAPEQGQLAQRGGGQFLATVARYARHDHYADLRRALSCLARVLFEHGWRARVLVDDNALVDRAAAQRAGLGWFGKNCNILLPGRGSWFILGSVVTNAPLPASKPVADGCGSCRRCQVACPTGALVSPGVLDARKCLAWLLQAPGPFPFEYREALGDRIYGCDDCQSCCPVNIRAVRESMKAPAGLAGLQGAATGADRSNRDVGAGPGSQPASSAGHAGTSQVDVLEMLSLPDQDLLRRYGRWYIPRRDPRYLRRNALVVLGNIGSPRDAGVEAALLTYLQSPDDLLRSHAIWAALRLGRGDLVDKTQLGLAELPPAVIEELQRREEVRCSAVCSGA